MHSTANFTFLQLVLCCSMYIVEVMQKMLSKNGFTQNYVKFDIMIKCFCAVQGSFVYVCSHSNNLLIMYICLMLLNVYHITVDILQNLKFRPLEMMFKKFYKVWLYLWILSKKFNHLEIIQYWLPLYLTFIKICTRNLTLMEKSNTQGEHLYEEKCIL